jgi:arylsulfatase
MTEQPLMRMNPGTTLRTAGFSKAFALATVSLLGWLGAMPVAAEIDRTALPIVEPTREMSTVLDARDAVAPPFFTVTAPEGAPNVLLILIDDLGFGGTSAFGGPISTPNFDLMASEGVAFSNFHTTATCSPTRASLLSGHNHHVVNMGGIAEGGPGFPGNTTRIPNETASIANILQLNGYNTAAYGKWHQTPPWETSMSGPFDLWPTGQGFEDFYGFIGFSTNHWNPSIIQGTNRIQPPLTEGYNFMTDMADQAVNWINSQQAMTPDKPFFLYFSPGAVRAPHHPPEEWAARWDGKFDAGWDVIRQEILDRQIAMGLVPAGTTLAPRPDAIPAWDSLSDDEKALYARQFEVYAGFLEYTDYEIGRVIDAVRATGELDNTLVIFVAGDNGAGAEGDRNGTANEFTYFNGVAPTVEELMPYMDAWGGPETLPHFSAGWSQVVNAPFGYTKQLASDFGGTRVAMAIRWPAGGVEADREYRTQLTHVIDVVPTILEATGLPAPQVVNGTAQRPMDGVSLLYSARDPAAPGQHETQYFEMFGNRAIYHEGWYARVIHNATWDLVPRSSIADGKWELYDTSTDFSLVNDLAAQEPEKLAELQALFLSEATRNFVLPMDDRTLVRVIPALAGRPDLMAGRTSLTLSQGMTAMPENVFLNTLNNSFSVTADVVLPETGGHGAIIVQGGKFGGWGLYMEDGIPALHYNFLNREHFTIKATEPVPPGEATIRYDFAYDGGGQGMGGTGRIYVNDVLVAEGRIEVTQAVMFSADETADVGIDLQTPVADTLGTGEATRFTGLIPRVTIALTPAP